MPNELFPVSAYQMAINNVARAIRAQKPAVWDDDREPNLNAFTASTILGAAFCKDPREVIDDIVNARL